jgi:hypothetical protein
MATINVPICSDFSAHPGDTIVWQHVPSGGCTISQSGPTWPFNPGPPLHLPAKMVITIKIGLPPGKYPFNVSCCPSEVIKTVTIM